MYYYYKYGPFMCIGFLIGIIFLLWLFIGDANNVNNISSLNVSEILSDIPKQEYCIPDEYLDIGLDENMNHDDQNMKIDEKYTQIKDNKAEIEVVMNLDRDMIDLTPNVANDLTEKKPIIKKRQKGVSKGEFICCNTMEKIYGLKFTKVKPKWLTNPETDYPLELDCYNKDLRMAVEYNGIQHYVWPNFTNQSKDKFISQLRRDKLKEELCAKKGVYLIKVPYNVKHEKIPEYIISHLPETIKSRLLESGFTGN